MAHVMRQPRANKYSTPRRSYHSLFPRHSQIHTRNKEKKSWEKFAKSVQKQSGTWSACCLCLHTHTHIQTRRRRKPSPLHVSSDLSRSNRDLSSILPTTSPPRSLTLLWIDVCLWTGITAGQFSSGSATYNIPYHTIYHRSHLTSRWDQFY